VAGQTLVGRVGLVTVRVRGGPLPGEVRLVVQGIPHYYIAYCGQALAVGEQVLVINNRGARQVDVEPWHEPGLDGSLPVAE
jgi:membrane protein implicated in regulation of membrane protease activity